MEDVKNQMLEQLLPLIPYIEIAHHVSGRIRLKILPSGLRIVQNVDIEALLASMPGILGIRVNGFARSVIIEYDHRQIPFDFWTLLAKLKHRPELMEEVTAHIERLAGNLQVATRRQG